ncbi:Glycosyl transferase family 2 [Rhodococcus rhodochrous J3]|uniref:Glycosyltransferase family 2 protein n=2 Tax=Rhodococcus rhodochrous TaxID=1829 RepID=A0AA46WXN1_RHORH|nr:glycosyltransferase family A protein [Rhodococcus rhodochrous]MBF4481485.1 glycosyltransferase family 2 protein [Rhodococcus rhodochrous]MCB8912806.1 glycosyltransferase family 2 protein [Rhodococcus rhodochrous]TWH52962.1 Glycosyltransferases, probably involved in cell wall biogenesis [Rhodococcus rhodochrous J38]UZF46290.1 glycosyltransferase family 2 protein [Rhodococcus rhodochrous]SMG32110.1 Glycosyl transferase family 2 [Rhodococcus rhodochrous J3]
MTQRPLVTVLVPAYNAAPYLREALDSILTQDHRDLELLVVDDGSTDDTAQVLAAIDDTRLRVVRQDNTGLVGALNRGLDESRGAFLARMDADDIMPPGRLSAQLRAMSDDPELTVCGTDYELFGAFDGRVRMPRTDSACRQRLLLASCHCGASVMIRSSVLQRSGIRFRPEFAHAEDYRFFTELAAHGRMGNLPIVGYRYRIHPHQVSAVYSDEQRAAHLRIAREYATATGVAALGDADLGRLLWAERPDGSLPVALARQLSSVAVPAARAVVRRPGVETVRFVSRKVFEAAARVRG